MDRKYQSEDDARMLKRYAELSGDSGRMKAAQGVLRKEMQQTAAVLGIKGKKG